MGQWDAPFAWPAVAINAALLPNRRVLTYGRHNHAPVLWDPVNPGSFTNLALPADFFCSGFAFLRDGRLAVIGGHAGVDNFGLKSTYLFSYQTGQWTKGADMRNGRWYPTATTLPNGQVLAISGGDTAAALNVLPEVYGPGTNRWRALTSAVRAVSYYPMMFVAPNGRVFHVGPEQNTAFLNTAGKGSWTPGPSRLSGYRDYGAAVMYDGGKILIAGGGSPTSSAEAIDLTGAGTWGFVGSMSVARRQVNLTLLADGTVLATGGTNASGFKRRAGRGTVEPGEPRRVEEARQHEPPPALSLDDAAPGRWTRALGRQWRAGGEWLDRRPHGRDLLTALPVQPRRHPGNPAGHHQRAEQRHLRPGVHREDPERGQRRQGHAGPAFGGDPLVQSEPAGQRPELLARQRHHLRDRARECQSRSAGALHDVHRERKWGAVGSEVRAPALSR
jgi:hypothetical protein